MRKDLPLKSVESMLDTFAARLSNSNLKECKLFVIEQSRQAYNLTKRLHEKEDDINDEIILSESDCKAPHEPSTIKDPLDHEAKEVLKRKIGFIKRKATRDIKNVVFKSDEAKK